MSKELTEQKVGRPTLFSEEMLQKAEQYIANCTTTEERVKLPTVQGLALHLGVDRGTIYQWEKEHPSFFNTLEKLRQQQHNDLVDYGLSGQYNSTIAKLLLTNNHGYRDKTESTSTNLNINADLPEEERERLSNLLHGESTGT